MRLIPRTFALIAVQRQRAASTSASPFMRVQQGFFGILPILRPSKFPRTLAQTPNFSVSIGQVSFFGTYGGGGQEGLGFGGGFGLGQVPQPETNVKKIRLKVRKRARVEQTWLEAIFLIKKNLILRSGFLGEVMSMHGGIYSVEIVDLYHSLFSNFFSSLSPCTAGVFDFGFFFISLIVRYLKFTNSINWICAW